MRAHQTKHKISDKSAGFSLFSVQPENNIGIRFNKIPYNLRVL